MTNNLKAGLGHIRCLAAAVLCALGVVLTISSAHAKTVSLVYDDSSSMSQGERWNPANYAMQVVTALLGDDDTLWLIRMSEPRQAEAYRGIHGAETLLRELKTMSGLARGSTPYPSIRTAIDKLAVNPKEENWLLVVTDADRFSDYDASQADRDIRDAVTQKRAHVIFVVIENPGNNQGSAVVDYWVNHGQAIRVDARAAKDLPMEMEKLATLLEHSAGHGGVKDRQDGNEIVVSSLFPLRRLTMLRQDAQPGTLLDARHRKLGALDLRQHLAQARKPIPQTSSTARIYHLRTRQVMEAGEDAIRLRFDAATAQMRYKLIPDVAARFEVTLKDDLGHPLPRDNSGYYTYCEGTEIEVEARLLDDSGAPITLGRTDLGNFEVGINHAPGNMAIDARQERFHVKLKPTGNTGLTAHARYAGYFHLLGDPMQLRPGTCAKDIRLFVKSGLDSTGVWSAPVDAVGKAPHVRLGATVDGRPMAAEEFERWALRDGSGLLDIEKEGTDWLIRPRDVCCAFFLSRPEAGLFSAALSLEADRPTDKITLPPAFKFNLTAPATRNRQLWWVACPYVTWIGLLLTAWYLWRLAMKERFGAKARLWIYQPEERSTHSVMLRKKASWLLRWFWPSRREKANIDDMTFFAIGKRGAAILVAGKNLSEKNEIDGWLYDESRAERGLPQADARLPDGGEIAIRHPQPTRFNKFSRRYRYTTMASTIPEDW